MELFVLLHFHSEAMIILLADHFVVESFRVGDEIFCRLRLGWRRGTCSLNHLQRSKSYKSNLKREIRSETNRETLLLAQ